MITFRLVDALPTERLAELQQDPEKPDDTERRKRLEELMDAGHGACHLRNPRIARLVEGALWHFDGALYRLLAWVVMPNHVHTLIEPLAGSSLSRIMHAWKSFTAKEANNVLGLSGRFWQPEYYDRAIRDERHWRSAVEYIHENPVRAGLVGRCEEWPYSSASREYLEPRAGGTPALPAHDGFHDHGAGGTPALPEGE